ncbi:MAG TPA: MFS transporter [Acidobacteriaceae bacterium]|nr:MFS transporter [Acidobacteriaceae bacterium]
MSSATTEPRVSIPKRRWRIAFLLSLGVLVNYFDRINLSVSHAALISTFAISDVTFGYLSAAYNWTYALCQLPIGVLLDKFGIRRVGRVSTLVWSVASFAAAATPNLAGFFGARLLLGVGEAPTFPANAKAIGYWFPSKERGTPTGLFDGAAKLGPAIGVPLIGLLLLRVGWRWSFAATGFASFLYFLLFYRVYRDPAEDPGLSPQEREYILAEHAAPAAEVPSLSGSISLGYLLRQRKVLGLALGFGSYNYVFYLLLTWLPSYLSYALHIDLLHSFLYTGVPWIIATITDIFVGGWLVDQLIARGWRENLLRRIVLIGGTTLGLGIVGAAFSHTPTQALVWISISIGGLSAAAPIGWTIPSLLAPGKSVGTIAGILNFSNQLSGIAAPIITGYVVTAFHSFAWAFGVSAAYLIIGILAYLFLLGRIEPIQEEGYLAA